MTAREALADYQAGRYAEAAKKYQALIAASPKSASLHFNLGCALQALDKAEAAIDIYARGAALDPTHTGMLNNLANALRGEGRYPEAIRLFDRVIELEPDKANAHLNLGLALLANGEYERGWKEYEWRHSAVSYHQELRETRPAWKGDPSEARGKRILVYCAQGLGDEVQCLRYLPMLAGLGAQVILETQPPLAPLMQQVPGVTELVLRDQLPLPEFDLHVEMFSLPGYFDTTRETIPPPIPLEFTPDPEIEKIIRSHRAKAPDKKHIGFIWTGNPGNTTNPKRSIAAVAFDHLSTVLAPGKLQLYSLQKGVSESPPASAIDLGPQLKDFASTATAFRELDHIISIDSAVGHLAGNQGVPLSMLLHHHCDWRWIPEGKNSWYPNAKMYRQPAPGQWKLALESLAKVL